MFFTRCLNDLLETSQGQKILEAIELRRGTWLTGVWGASRAYVAGALISRLRRSGLIVCLNEEQALAVHDELRFFLQGFASLSRPGETSEYHVKYPAQLDPGTDPLVYFPAISVEGVEAVNREHGKNIERLLILGRLAAGEPMIVVTSLPALLQKQVAPEALLGASIDLKIDRDYPLDQLCASLLRLGYRREASVEEPGQFCVRGGIVDIAPPDRDAPLRLEFFGDALESLREFDPSTQKSLQPLQAAAVMPFHELILEDAIRVAGLKRLAEKGKLKPAQRKSLVDKLAETRHFGGLDHLMPYFYPDCTLFDYFEQLPQPPLVFLDQPQAWRDTRVRLADEALEVQIKRAELGQAFPDANDFYMPFDELEKKLRPLPRLAMSLLPHSMGEFKDLHPLGLTFKSLSITPSDPQSVRNEAMVWMSQGARIVAACHTHGDLTRLKAYLEERQLPCRELGSDDDTDSLISGEIGLCLGRVEKGFWNQDARLALVSDHEILRRSAVQAPRVYRHRYKGLKGARKIESFAELKAGDYAVHLRHGISLFRGVTRLVIEEHAKDFVFLEYADNEKLYVPVDQVNLVQKYLGGEEQPRLHKLGAATWQNQQEKVKKSVAELAQQLLKLYAQRQVAQAPSSGPDSSEQKTFEESFPFEETEDQLRAIEDCKRDLESRKPMDRLLCGDVGFGKTEVALRAAFKAVMAGQQVAVLVPTTILAQQHYSTFLERLADFPVKLGLLSRFRSPKEIKETIESLEKGSLDIVVGTHRLLSQDVKFKRLGLIVVDEEQRFGVAHKERLKNLRASVGVLSMSATPVPRTLHFSLSGLRDMSMIETPPLDRLPVRTYVLEENEGILRDAIQNELKRQGQIFFVHHRVKDIEKVAERLRALVPEARVAVAHGQMPKHDLEKAMVEFLGRAHDVLVATTIIESGLDIPNVNTIIINHSENFGLSQLYQLRGRVGRSGRQAYAYLFYPKGRALPEVAEKRLAAMEEFTDLGSGFKVAMRDLEIRGVGNILGPEQHGHVAAVGFDLYCHLLQEAVAKLKGEDVEPDRTPILELDMDAYLPETYVEDARQKMDWYKRLSNVETFDELADLRHEMKDRYGIAPMPAQSLIDAVEIRVWARELGLSQVVSKPDQIILRWFDDRLPGGKFATDLMARFKENIRFLVGPPPGLALKIKPGQALAALRSLLPQLKPYVKISSRELA